MKTLDQMHSTLVYGRRTRVLADALAKLIPQNACVLDVGCGDGLIDRLILDRRDDVRIEGVDVLARERSFIPVALFDGRRIPFDADTFDAVMFVDVLHHTYDPMLLLREAARVSRRHLILKDHTRDGLFAGTTLRLMDWVGNARYGVALPYNYWRESEWRTVLAKLGLGVEVWNPKVGLYPRPLSLLFDRSLHFVARVQKESR